jgi:hypothetical protein
MNRNKHNHLGVRIYDLVCNEEKIWREFKKLVGNLEQEAKGPESKFKNIIAFLEETANTKAIKVKRSI